MTLGSAGHQDGAAFAHTVVVVESDDAVATRLLPALRASLAAGERVLMVVREPTAALVRDTLGRDSARLDWQDPTAFYQGLGAAYERFRRYLAEEHAAGRQVHVVAEPDLAGDRRPSVPADRAAAYLCYESICNESYAPYGSPVTCLWDTRCYPPAVVDGARRTHRFELTDAGRLLNPRYQPPEEFLAECNDAPLDQPPEPVDHDLRLIGAGQLALVRAALRAWSEEHRFAPAAATNVQVAVTEVAANGLTHGTPPVRVRAWRHSGTLIVQVDDGGGPSVPATAGFRPPQPAQRGGRGLWLARQMADTVAIHTAPDRTSVRLHFPAELIQTLSVA